MPYKKGYIKGHFKSLHKLSSKNLLNTNYVKGVNCMFDLNELISLEGLGGNTALVFLKQRGDLIATAFDIKDVIKSLKAGGVAKYPYYLGVRNAHISIFTRAELLSSKGKA